MSLVSGVSMVRALTEYKEHKSIKSKSKYTQDAIQTTSERGIGPHSQQSVNAASL